LNNDASHCGANFVNEDVKMTDATNFEHLENLDSQERYDYLIETAVEQQQIWILSDSQGFVLLNSDEGDCLPVWPHKETAQKWVNGDWKDCTPEAIALDVWQSRWTQGLTEDKLVLAAFPNSEEEALVLDPSEFNEDLTEAMSV
jgi:hypothetical protein